MKSWRRLRSSKRARIKILLVLRACPRNQKTGNEDEEENEDG